MVMREPIDPEGRKPQNPAKLALAVGVAGALLILAVCAGCGGLMALLENLQGATP